MEKQQIGGAIGLLLVTALLLTTLTSGVHSVQEEMEPAGLPRDEARQTLQEYFHTQYSEAACSAIYADLTHDGVEELVVLEMGVDRSGEPILLHSGAVDEFRFTGGRVAVLEAAPDGGVQSIFSFECTAEEPAGLYLQRQNDLACLLKTAPGEAACLFFLGEDGLPVELPAEEESLREAKPLLVCESALAYLNELFTSY